MKTTIVFVHGMFQNARSWDNWANYFSRRGFNCVVESWPLHSGSPKDLRTTPPSGIGDLRLTEIIDQYADIVQKQREPVILIGHSVGGLVVQSLLNQGLGTAGVCISSVSPNRMLAFDWGFFKNSISISNPLKGDEPFYMTPEIFHASFCNTMSREDSDHAYEQTAVHDSRNVLRDCMSETGVLDLSKTVSPLLFISGDKDEIIPPQLVEKNVNAYQEGQASMIIVPEKGHWICNESGWNRITDEIYPWIKRCTIQIPVD